MSLTKDRVVIVCVVFKYNEKNPKFYKEFKERSKRLWKASSFGSVLGKGN